MKVAFLFLPPWDPQFPSYAMALFKGSTKEAGHEFIGYDLNVDLYRSAPRKVRKLWNAQVANLWSEECDKIVQELSCFVDPYIEHITANEIDLYAMSINVYSKHLAFYIAQKIKKIRPKACIFIGGPQCFPAYDGLNILENKCVDAICTGEGDLVWPKVLEHFAKNRNLHLDMPGLSYRNDAGNVIDNGVPEIVRNLNQIPYADYSDVDLRKYGNKYQFSIMTSRGCINTCAFCSEKPNFYQYRFRTADNIYNEVVKHLCELQNNPTFPSNKSVIPYICFNDSLINGIPRELEKFCDLVIDGGLKFRWSGMALIRKELTHELLAKMKRAGCSHLSWGLESGCQEVLDLMHKSFFDMILAKKVIKLVHEVGISQSVSLIAGFPGETEEMFIKTKEFITEYKDYFAVSIQPMMIAKNSLVYINPEKFGIKDRNDWLQWQTIDGSNTYDIRLQRVEMLRSVLGEKLVTIDKGRVSGSGSISLFAHIKFMFAECSHFCLVSCDLFLSRFPDLHLYARSVWAKLSK